LAQGVALTETNCALRDTSPADALAGKLKFDIPRRIYGARSVKNALAIAQFSKCCFCEGIFDAHYRGDVEHYRPKNSVTVDGSRIYPGYYWLAFEPENLYYACADCNQYRKRDLFPLVDEGVRARSHHDQVANEDPLILDPSGPRNPRLHIRFYHDVPVGVTEAGRRTIESLRLDREPLNKRRRRLIARLKDHRSTVQHLADDPRPDIVDKVTMARLELAEAVRPDAEFSSAAIDYLADWFPP
jgi:hypothetical protein